MLMMGLTYMEKERIVWVDNTKAIALFLVVWGHFLCGGIVKTIIYSFHVPLFFIVSGFIDDVCGKSRRFRFRALLMPYIIWVIISYLVWLGFPKPPLCSLVRSLVPIDGFELWNHPLWFLWVLFWVQALVPNLNKLFSLHSESVLSFGLEYVPIMIFLCLCVITFILWGDKNILAYRQVLFGIIFYEIGAIVARLDILRFLREHIAILTTLLLLGLLASIANGGVSIFAWRVHNLLLLIVSGTFLSLVVMFFVRYWLSCGTIRNESSMLLLCTHFYLLLCFRQLPLCLRNNFYFATLCAFMVYVAYVVIWSQVWILVKKKMCMCFASGKYRGSK